MVSSSITIVTAFFDIGRENWNTENGYKNNYTRTTDTYLDYFKNLAKLNNQIIVFTSPDLYERIKKIRKGKPTTIILIDFNKKFKFLIKRIREIQSSESYKEMIPLDEQKKPEYISPEYVLLTNLKPYFVTKAIKMKLVSSDLVAWIDFGYCRNDRTVGRINEWNYLFDKSKLNCFTINKLLQQSDASEALDQMLKGKVLIIGGALVGGVSSWLTFYDLICRLYKKALNDKFVDDDQYFITMCYYNAPQLVKPNYLGKSKWFDLFKRYRNNSLHNYFFKINSMVKSIFLNIR